MLDGALHCLYTFARAMRHRGKFTDSFENGGDVKIPILPAATLDGAVSRWDTISRNISDNHHGRATQGRFNSAKQPGRGGIAALRHENSRPARQAAIHLRHTCRRLLIARYHDFDLVLLVIQGFEKTPSVPTRNAKYMVNARFL
jgi:hypothetical protein